MRQNSTKQISSQNECQNSTKTGICLHSCLRHHRLFVTEEQQVVADTAIFSQQFTMSEFFKLICTYFLIVTVTSVEENNCSADGDSCSNDENLPGKLNKYSEGIF